MNETVALPKEDFIPLSHSYAYSAPFLDIIHQNTFPQAILIREEQGSIEVGNNHWSVVPGDIVCIPENTYFINHFEGVKRIGVVIFQTTVHDLGLPRCCLLHDQDGLFEEAFQLTMDVQELESPHMRALAYNLHCTMRTILEHWGAERSSMQMSKVGAVYHLLQENFYDPDFDLAAVIEQSGYCPSHFRRIFREIIGRTPVQQLNYFRIEFAKTQILLYGDLYSLKELSQNSGFRDPYYFSRTFSQFTGVSPSEFLRKTQENAEEAQ